MCRFSERDFLQKRGRDRVAGQFDVSQTSQEKWHGEEEQFLANNSISLSQLSLFE